MIVLIRSEDCFTECPRLWNVSLTQNASVFQNPMMTNPTGREEADSMYEERTHGVRTCSKQTRRQDDHRPTTV